MAKVLEFQLQHQTPMVTHYNSNIWFILVQLENQKRFSLEVNSVEILHRNTHTWFVIALSNGISCPSNYHGKGKKAAGNKQLCLRAFNESSLLVSLRLKLHLSQGIGSILYLMCQIINSNLLRKRKKSILCCQVKVVETVIRD